MSTSLDAREEFAHHVGAAVQQAGRPTLERIAETSTQLSGKVSLSTSTVSSWRRGKSLPAGPEALESFLATLERIAGIRGLFDRAEWQRLYRNARNAVPVSQGPPSSTVGEATAFELGVHRARAEYGESGLTGYITRDIDHAVRAVLARLASEGGMLLLSGDSTAGKTRTAFEAVQAVMPQAELLLPGRRTDLGQVAADCARRGVAPGGRVLWLDDLQRHLGPMGLDVDLLRIFRKTGVVVVATIQLGFRQQIGSTGLGEDVLRASEELVIPRIWSESELARAEQEAYTSGDGRLKEALRQAADHGVAEYLAAGPELWRELAQATHVTGNARGAAMVRAAIGLALAGISTPLPVGAVERLHEVYIPGRNKALLAPESPDHAIEWATKVRHGVTAFLLPKGDGFYAFDYLVGATLREANAGEPLLPEAVWDAAIEMVTDDLQYFEIATAATANDRPDLVRRVLTPLAERDQVVAMRALGLMLRRSDGAEAEGWLRRAVGLGDVLSMRLLGNHFMLRHEYDEANEWFQHAADAGDEESVAFFRRPGIRRYPLEPVVGEPLGGNGEPEPEEADGDEDDQEWGPSPRTLAVLAVGLGELADLAAQDVDELGDQPVTVETSWEFDVFGDLPAQTWRAAISWRRDFVRCFDDLAEDIRGGGWPRPLCTGEEMALHLALDHVSGRVAGDPEFVARATEGIDARNSDYDWYLCESVLFEDTDVLWLFEPWLNSVADPDDPVNQMLGVANLQPADWFEPFREGSVRDPERGYRHWPAS